MDRGPTGAGTRETAIVRYLTWVTVALVAVYVVSVIPGVRPRAGYSAGLDGVLETGTWILIGILCVLRARRSPARAGWTVVGLGILVEAAGQGAWFWVVQSEHPVPYPSIADAGYLAFYPLTYLGLALVVRERRGPLSVGVWLDGLLGGLTVAAVACATVLSPVLTLSGGAVGEVVTNLAYPIGDVALLAVIGGALVVGRGGRSLWLLAGSMFATAVGDAAYLLQESRDTYRPGSWVDVLWTVALLIAALAAPARSERPPEVAEPDGLPGAFHLAVDTERRDLAPAATDRRDPAVAVPDLAAPAGKAAAIPAGSAAATGPDGVVARAQTWPLFVLPFVLVLADLAVLDAHPTRAGGTAAAVLASAAIVAAICRLVLTLREVAQLAETRRQARTDELTGLLNRRGFYAQVTGALDAEPPGPQALLLLDLDRFKEVNDSLGHQAGDQLLALVGQRLRSELGAEDLLGRLGGDEFAVLLAAADTERALTVAERLRAALITPFAIDGVGMRTDASIGIALSPQHGRKIGQLLRSADVAMYQAKTAGCGQRVFSIARDAERELRLRTVVELRTALAQDQLVLHYQPKADPGTGRVTGVEALVRWDHPTRGLLYPEAFLSAVQDAGLMPALTQVVLETALDQAVAWAAAGRPLKIAVNLSASSLVDTELAAQVGGLLRARGLPASALQLEITEEFLLSDRARARLVLSRLRDLGVTIAVDDFGTGYSSLSYLRELPLDELKLDQSFVFPMADDARAAALVRSILELAHSLGLRMVAEGVENETAYTELARYGCDEIQGYYLSRPVPAAALDLWLDRRAADRPAQAPAPSRQS